MPEVREGPIRSDDVEVTIHSTETESYPIDVGVNGRSITIERDRPTRIPREYFEVLKNSNIIEYDAPDIKEAEKHPGKGVPSGITKRVKFARFPMTYKE